MVLDLSGNPLPFASVSVSTVSGPHGKSVETSARGEYWAVLLAGEYSLTAQAAGCSSPPVRLVLTEQQQLVVRNMTVNTECSL